MNSAKLLSFFTRDLFGEKDELPVARHPQPTDEAQRLARLLEYEVLDTPAEHEFDRLTEIAARVCGTPISLISLVDKERQWFKSHHGLAARETPREVAFCAHAILDDAIFEIEDSMQDARFCRNPLVLGEPHVRFYAGAPLRTPEGHNIGTLCVIDHTPRRLTQEQREILCALAESAIQLLELRRKNRELTQLTTQYREVQEMVKAGGWSWDLATGETLWADEVYNIYQLPVGTPTTAVDGISYYAPHERERLQGLLQKCVQELQSFDERFAFVDEKKAEKWVRVLASPVLDDAGGVTRIRGTIQDVTEQVRRELELDEQKQITMHQSKLASIGALAAGVGHEINNPLAVVLGQLECLRDLVAAAPGISQEGLERVGKAIAGVERIGAIAKGLRAFARTDAAEYTVFDLNQMVRQTTDLMDLLFERAGVKIIVSGFGEFPVHGSPGRIQQILMNLLSNARDALAESEVREVRLDLAAQGERVKLSIQDTGPGISAAIGKKIFEPFFTTKASGKGTGLGLSIAHAIARDHGGELVLAPSARGARFELVLPLSQERIAAPAGPAIRPASKEKLHILVVDDEPDLRSILAEMFVRMGHEAATASHGIEALQKVQRSEKAFDLVVTDFMMPELDGPGLVIALREQLSYKGKICMITGGVDFNLGPVAPLLDARLTKPFKRDQLLEMLAAVAATK